MTTEQDFTARMTALAIRGDLAGRMELGRLLLQVKQEKLYRNLNGGSASWGDFLKRAFPALTGLRDRSAVDAMELAPESHPQQHVG